MKRVTYFGYGKMKVEMETKATRKQINVLVPSTIAINLPKTHESNNT